MRKKKRQGLTLPLLAFLIKRVLGNKGPAPID